jgi:hypothetical protein
VFDSPERAVTPGQWAVVFDGEDRVLAAGIIDEFTPAPAFAEASEGQALAGSGNLGKST